jgi:RNA polymerase sigma factor (sigma-70 family)
MGPASYSPDQNHRDDAEIAARCLSHDEAALLALKEQHYHRLISVAIARGASPTEAADLVADVWGELVSPAGGKQPLLEKYCGRCSLAAWLITVVTHRFIDRRRRGRLFTELGADLGDEFKDGAHLSAPRATTPEGDLLQILRLAVTEAFQNCPPETLVMLKLVYLHGISQRKIGRLWGWHESQVSRHIDRGLQEIQGRILARIKRTDGFLEVNWNDFLDLCQGTVNLFGA